MEQRRLMPRPQPSAGGAGVESSEFPPEMQLGDRVIFIKPDGSAFAAYVACMHESRSGRLVNLAVLNNNGEFSTARDVRLLTDRDVEPTDGLPWCYLPSRCPCHRCVDADGVQLGVSDGVVLINADGLEVPCGVAAGCECIICDVVSPNVVSISAALSGGDWTSQFTADSKRLRLQQPVADGAAEEQPQANESQPESQPEAGQSEPATDDATPTADGAKDEQEAPAEEPASEEQP